MSAIHVVNAKNQIHGVIQNIILGDVVSEVQLQTRAGTICSVITTSSLKALDLKVGDSATAIAKATDVLIAK